VRGELEAPAALGGRFARACPIHKRLLDGLECPMGHHVEQWATYDRQKAVFMFEGVEADKPEILDAPRGVPQPGGPAGDQQFPNREPKPRKESPMGASNLKVIASKRLDDEAGVILYIQVVLFTPKNAPKVPMDRYRIRWRRHEGKKNRVGVAATAPDEAKARATHALILSAAYKDGWRDAPVAGGTGRALVLQSVPSPSRPVRRGRPRKA